MVWYYATHSTIIDEWQLGKDEWRQVEGTTPGLPWHAIVKALGTSTTHRLDGNERSLAA